MILVTGGTGLVGSYLLHKLVNKQLSVRALYRATSSWHLVDDIKDQIEWVEADLLDIPALENAFTGVTHIYHCAGLVAFHPGAHKKLIKVNQQGTANIVNLAIDYNIEKLVHVSSTAALGTPPHDHDIDESIYWQNNTFPSQYALSKFLGEREVWRGVGEGLRAAIVNPSIVLGAGDWSTDSSVFFKVMHDGLKFYPVGTNGFVDAQDVADIMMNLMDSNIHAERFLVSAANWSYKKLLTTIAHHVHQYPPRIPATFLLREMAWRLAALKSFFTRTPPVITKETVRSSARQLHFNNTKVREQLNFEFTPLEATIARISQTFLQEKN